MRGNKIHQGEFRTTRGLPLIYESVVGPAKTPLMKGPTKMVMIVFPTITDFWMKLTWHLFELLREDVTFSDFGAMFWFLDQVFKTFNIQQKDKDYGKHVLKRKSVIPKRFLKQISSQHLFWRNHACVFFALKKSPSKQTSIHPVRTKKARVPKRKWQVGYRTCPDGLALKNTWAKNPQLQVDGFLQSLPRLKMSEVSSFL